jgi:predicted dehydrogenase
MATRRAERTVRAGLVGTGFGGAVVLPALETVPGIEVTAVCSARLERAKALAEAHDIGTAVSDFGALAERDDIDLVLVCTPPLLQAKIIRTALESGRHVFATKPIAPAASTVRELRDLARERGAITAMDLDNRYIPVRRYVRHLVDEGYLGELRSVVGTVFLGLATDPAHRHHYWGWTSLREQGGGILGTSLGLHHVDLLRFTFGEISEAGGLATTLIREKPTLAPGHDEWAELGPTTPTFGMRPVDVDDMFTLQGRFSAGGAFSLTVSWSIHHGSGVRLEAYGSEGTLVLDPSGRLSGGRSDEVGLAELPVPEQFGERELAVSRTARFASLFAELARSIGGSSEKPLFATFEDGVRLRELAEGISPGPT